MCVSSYVCVLYIYIYVYIQYTDPSQTKYLFPDYGNMNYGFKNGNRQKQEINTQPAPIRPASTAQNSEIESKRGEGREGEILNREEQKEREGVK